MPLVKKSITVTDRQEKWSRLQIESGQSKCVFTLSGTLMRATP